MRINWNGKRRWIALLLVIISIILMLRLPPVIPVIQLPGEVWPGRQLFGLPITNTLVGSAIVWILIGLLCFYISRARPKSDSEAPRGGFYNFFEMAYEGLYGFLQGIAGGPHMRFIFSIFMTIFLVVLLSNWLELIPGVDSVGFLEPRVRTNVQTGQVEPLKGGYDTVQSGPFYYLNPKCPWVSPQAAAALADGAKAARAANGCVTGTGAPVVAPAGAAATQQATTAATPAATAAATEAVSSGAGAGAAEGGHASAGQAAHFTPGSPDVPWVVLPYVRVPSTDLNMTLALALISVFMIQYMGVRALGLGYFNKFLPFGKLITSAQGGMDLVIGLLELLGEFARILSFSFRLLGNIFAGSILLFVVSFLVPAVVPWALFLFEFAVGILQALIFALLTAIFMNTATIGHHAEGHEERDAAH